MKDTSDLPDVIEQTKSTGEKPKPAVRPRENVTVGSQEQDTKSAPRRRPPTSVHGSPAARNQSGGEKVMPSAPSPAPASTTRPAPAPPSRPAPTAATGVPPRAGGGQPQRMSGAPNQAQRGSRPPAA